MNTLQFFFIILYIAAILSLLYGLWVILPLLYSFLGISIEQDRIRRALEMVDLKPNELLYDLGIGDGQVLFIAEEEFRARAIALRANFLQTMFVKARIFLSGKQAQVYARSENFYQSDISDADVVFVYMRSYQAISIQKSIEKKLKAGTRIVSVSANFPDWKPSDFDDDYLIFLYEMPPQEGGLAAYFAEQKDF